jgi:hypothetical protein
MLGINIFNDNMYRNLDLQLIRTFCTVAQHGSMTVAGNILAQTQGAVSQQVKRLEETMDCLLFVRDRRDGGGRTVAHTWPAPARVE